MAFYRCSVCAEDGSPLAEGIRVVIETGGDGGGWYGTITATHTAQLEAGHTYRLTLEDGRSGRFRVQRNTFAGGVDRSVAIRGIDPLAAG